MAKSTTPIVFAVGSRTHAAMARHGQRRIKGCQCKAEIAELVAMLRKHEWVEHAASPPWSGVWLECPECEGVKPGSSAGDARGGREDGHAEACALAALLAKHPT